MATEFHGKIAEGKRAKLYRTLNSAMFFVVSFFLVNLLNDFVIAVVARIYGKISYISFHGIDRINADVSWTLKSVVFTFHSGPLFLIFLGVIAFRIFTLLKKKANSLKFFVLWIGIHCYVIAVFKIFSYAVLTHENFSVIAVYVNLTMEYQIIVSVLCLAAILIIGLILPKIILSTSPTHYYTKNRSRRKQYIIQAVVAPWFIGMIVTIAFYLPHDFYLTALILLLNGVLLLFTYFFAGAKNNRKINLLKYEPAETVNIPIAALLIIFYLISHLALSVPKQLF